MLEKLNCEVYALCFDFWSNSRSYRLLRKIAPEHPFLLDLEDKKSLFDQAAMKYSPKVN